MSGEAEENLFLQAMSGVTPLQQNDHADLKASSGVPDKLVPGVIARRQAAVSVMGSDRNFLSADNIPAVAPHDFIEFKREGIQHGVFRKLKQGRYSTDARLDLHRFGVEEARQSVFAFIRECMEHDIRSGMILHGKGDRNPEAPARLKSCVAHWLTLMEEVQAYSSAQPKDGGAGALYILLKKSERKKDQNRQKFMKGRLES
ncbi:MAG: DNA endonuclease SmrA [Pseudomonadales bacterium]|nr:DNA endonuclease SmrA [Pseudomonadales bacterium]